jgi:type III secretion protein J
VLVLAMMLGCIGCSAEIYHGLDEPEANEMVVVLEQHGIDADKARDPSGDNTWLVEVPEGQRVEAWRILEREGLPRPDVEGFGQFYPSGGLIPTASEERVLLQYATAQELQRSLLKIDGVLDAHVNLVMPEKPKIQLSGAETAPPRASVLVKYRARDTDGKALEPPVDTAAVRQLVAGGVEGLEPDAVEVMLTPAHRALAPLKDAELAQVGPVAVKSDNKVVLQGIIGGMFFAILVLSAGIVVLVVRRRIVAT